MTTENMHQTSDQQKSVDQNNFQLRTHGIRKSFGGVEVLHGIDLTIKGGSVLAVLGENGAGKSTMIKIISGAYQADDGTIEIDGNRVEVDTPRTGQTLGIRVIYQEMMNAPTLTVTENIFLGHLPNRNGMVQWGKALAQTEAVLDRLGVDIDPKSLISDLSIAEHQVIEIARALVADARLIVFDEPTSALSPEEVDKLFTFMRRLRDNGVAIVYITHRLQEVPEIADELVVFRDGYLVAEGSVTAFDHARIVEAMTGESLKAFDHHDLEREKGGAETAVLQVNAASLAPFFKNVSLEVQEGEIVSLFGRMGCGAMEVGESLFGLRSLDSGDITINGVSGQPANPITAKKRGVGYVPVDRKTQGLLPVLSAGENLTIAAWGILSNRIGILSQKVITTKYNKWKDKLSIHGTGGSSQEINTLSGGNQQKVVLGRWLENNSAILVLAEPTRGVDVGARAEIYEVLEDLAEDGMAILIISTDAEEVLRVSDRILVMSRGRITDSILRAEASLGRLATSSAASVQA
jgi:ribose transport system ATP-binding protein